jgi:hypothetical protein
MQKKRTAAKAKKPQLKVKDLKPAKNAKGGALRAIKID